MSCREIDINSVLVGQFRSSPLNPEGSVLLPATKLRYMALNATDGALRANSVPSKVGIISLRFPGGQDPYPQ